MSNAFTSSIGFDIGISAELFVWSSDSCCVNANVPLSVTFIIDHIVSVKRGKIKEFVFIKNWKTIVDTFRRTEQRFFLEDFKIVDKIFELILCYCFDKLNKLPPKQEPFDVNSRHLVWKEPSSEGLCKFTEMTVHWPGSTRATGTTGRFSFDVLFI